jgi:hypothetical protein
MGMVYDDPTTDPRGVALSHEGVLAAVLLDGANTSSYSGTPGEPGSALRYAGAEPVLSWVAECECGWRGPECLAVLHPRPDRCPGSRHPSSTRPGGRPGTPTSRPCSPPRTDRGPRPRAERDRDVAAVDLLIARNPDPDSTLPYLLRVPLGGGLVFRTKGTWPRTSALYCHPVPVGDWPEEPELVERVPLRACARRGAAIDVVADRGREARSQIVFTRARGREVVFWQSPEERAAGAPALGDVHRERGLARSRRDRVQLTRAAGALASAFHARATTGTVRAHLISVPARLARSARRLTLHLPRDWPWEAGWQELFTAVHGHHRTHASLTTRPPRSRPAPPGGAGADRRLPHDPSPPKITGPGQTTPARNRGGSRLNSA